MEKKSSDCKLSRRDCSQISSLRLIANTLSVAGLIIGLRGLGWLQPLELMAYDQMFQRRWAEPRDGRVALITIDEVDIRSLNTGGIFSDQKLADILERIKGYQPRAIGLDIYRDLPVAPGEDRLQAIFKTTPNLIGIETLADAPEGVNPPLELARRQQVGFNNVVSDLDGVVRRNTLFLKKPGESATHRSFALKLALVYLKPQGIELKKNRLGGAEFLPFKSSDGAYVDADEAGYQILANLRSVPPTAQQPHAFQHVSLTELMAPASAAEQQRIAAILRDRVVLIGKTASSFRDVFFTSYSSRLGGNARATAGVELQGQFVSQILSAALDGRSLIRTWDDRLEWLWILGWAGVGTLVSWQLRSPKRSVLVIGLVSLGVVGICSGAFWLSWWIPLVPPWLALVCSAAAVTAHFAHQQEEFKKSQEFLRSIINTIPDPVYVKDRQHHWRVLNDAYCQFIEHPAESLLDRSDFDFFPTHEAAHFWQQDELAFGSRMEQECEEEFTTAQGKTYLVATKRSLYRDKAGNLFLVGVMRDITQRKLMEEALRSTADELVRSNSELAKAKDLLSHIAYHDPLTNLPNRKRFQEQLQQSIAWAREKQHLVALLFLDLDGFKQVNDTHGHQIGDLLLKAVAQRLVNCLRNSDIVARLGGDEFVAILPGIPTVQDVRRVAEKILSTLAQGFVFDGIALSISTSIGISLYPNDTQELDELIHQADTAMYRAKRLGKNRYELFQPAIGNGLDNVGEIIGATIDVVAD